ncbi:DNase I-like protein [Dacryopinax primogenitus]|uniref:DNase I-like protein n=1 Tax=Dacryopinax primogenitus (strain DJM 731) TaxID=1858805 RepID=M5GGR7_DACPD|nr:DNase I-like protein [Dacryopinax primogenitus]EJU05958.1 DNase I-like protein [Dacryopinax primogenitus]
MGLPQRSPSSRSLSPVPRSSSAPSVSAPRAIPNGSLFHESTVPEHGPFTESPPPLPARPGGAPLTDELGRRLPPSAPPSSSMSLRHRPTVSTSAVPARGPPPSVPPRPSTSNKISPVLRPEVLSSEAPPLPSRPRISPISSTEDPSTIHGSGSNSSVVASPSSSSGGTPSQGVAPPLPLRKVNPPLPVSGTSLGLSPETPPSIPRMPRSVPPMHPAIEKRQASLHESSTSPPPAPNPVPAHTPPPTRAVDLLSSLIPSSSLPHLPPPSRSIPNSIRAPKREKSGDDDSESEEEYENGDLLSPPGASGSSVHLPVPGTGLRRGIEDMPDTTHSNRRPPHMFVDQRSFPARSHLNQWPVVAMAGSFVVVANWGLTVYDIDKSDTENTVALSVSLEETGLEWRVKEPRVTAVEFRPGAIKEEDGRYAWCGTKDGHLWELDLWTGRITETRSQAHSSAVTHIFRHQRSMITIEESGKMFVFDSDEASGMGAPQMSMNPRLIRIGEKQTFAKVLGKHGEVWTSEGSGPGTVGGAKSLSSTPTKGPTIRIYDIRSQENGGVPYRTIVCPEPLGAVTTGCILPTQPDTVYLGHEGGCLSIWSLADEEPKFITGVKIGPTDILALEGVTNRLWIGNRQGIIAAYDVAPWPWKLTNLWRAHGDNPVSKLMVDVIGIERNQRLAVLSMGKDEKVRIWDGLLTYHWINDELLKREEQFSTFRPINVLLCTWNVDAAKPEMLTGTPDNATFFEQVLHSVNAPDIIVFSFQELIDLDNRKLTAKTVLLGGGKRSDGGISDKVSSRYRLWYEKLVYAVRVAMPAEQPYVPILTENLVGLFTCVFARASEKSSFKDVHITTVKRGMGGMYGNKGAIVARFTVDDSSLCFINCHLAAGQRHVRERNTDVAAVMEDKTLLPESEIADDDNLAYGGGGDGTMALDHEICFLNGDLNYRIDQRRDTVITNIKNDSHADLLAHDQLQKELKNNPGFRLRGFREAPITFKPTYKYDRRSDDYDSSGKQRTPAWCDRILFRCRDPKRIEPLAYKRLEPNISDHRPVVGVFRVTVKSLTHELRQKVKQQLLEEWKAELSKTLGLAVEAYGQQGLLVNTQAH